MSSNKRNLNKEIIGLFSGQTRSVTIPKLYIDLTRTYNKANILNQCIFWSTHSQCKDGWFYKKYDDWFQETHLSERTVRRTLFYLEEQGWITTKIKKVTGLNIKHIKPNIDKIIDAISDMLDSDCPNRPECHSGSEIKPKTCTKTAPTGQLDRLEPAKVTGSSIDTDNYKQIKLTNCESSSSFLFSETTDRNLLNQKLERDERSDEEFLAECVDHVENHSDKKFPRLQRAGALVKLLKKLKSDNVIFRESEKEKLPSTPQKSYANETDQERQNRQFIENELRKEREMPGYRSKILEQHPDMRARYA